MYVQRSFLPHESILIIAETFGYFQNGQRMKLVRFCLWDIAIMFMNLHRHAYKKLVNNSIRRQPTLMIVFALHRRYFRTTLTEI